MKQLINENIQVKLLSRNAGSREGIEYIKTDYSFASLKEILTGVDAIVHLASPRKVYDNFSEYFDSVVMTENLYKIAIEYKISNIIYASSISVYSGNSFPYNEEMATDPKNYYGAYKLLCEKIGNIYNEKGLCVKNLRFAHIYGANENNNYMINVFFRNAFDHKQLKVFAKSYAKREMLYAKDAASAIMSALKHPELKGVFNIGSGNFLTNLDIAETICKIFSPELAVECGEDEETITSSYMSSNKAESDLQYVPKYDFEKAVKEIKEEMMLLRG